MNKILLILLTLNLINIYSAESSNTENIMRDGDTQLHIACKKQDLNAISTLLESNDMQTYLNSINTYGETALHIACEENNLDIVKMLIKYGADLNISYRDITIAYYVHKPLDLLNSENLELLLDDIYINTNDYLRNYSDKAAFKSSFKNPLGYSLLNGDKRRLIAVRYNLFPMLDYEIEELLFKQISKVPDTYKIGINLSKKTANNSRYALNYQKIIKRIIKVGDYVTLQTIITSINIQAILNPLPLPTTAKNVISELTKAKKLLPEIFSPKQIGHALFKLIKNNTDLKAIEEIIKLIATEFDLLKIVDKDGDNLLHVVSKKILNNLAITIISLESYLLKQNNNFGETPIEFMNEDLIRELANYAQQKPS